MVKKSAKREIIEWVVLITIIATLYLTGYHTNVIGFIQRAALSTGLFKPDTQLEENRYADYNIRLTHLEGGTIDFESFKGKTIFVNFWATWCPPCIAEMPDIQSLYEKTGQEIVFVMISVDQNRPKARDFISKKEYEFPVYFLESNLPAVYDAHSIPTTYVISPDGKIVAEKHGMAKYDSEEFRNFLLTL